MGYSGSDYDPLYLRSNSLVTTWTEEDIDLCTTYNTGGSSARSTYSISEDYLINAVRENLKRFGEVSEKKRLEMAVKIITRVKEAGTDRLVKFNSCADLSEKQWRKNCSS